METAKMYRGPDRTAGQSQIWKSVKFFIAGIVLALLLLCVHTDAQAADTSGSCGDHLTWSYDSDSGVLTIAGYGEMTDYTSSSSAPWYTYRSGITEVAFDCTDTSAGITIGTYAFRSCSKITEADISGTVSVGSYAFYSCTGLEDLSGTDAVTEVSDHAFYNCKNMNGFDISGVTSIGSYAFYNNSGFIEVTLNAAITEIADYAFQRCMNLESVVALGDLTAIGEGAFYQCYALDTLVYDAADQAAGVIYIADTVETIGKYAFYQCTSYDEETGTEPAGGISEVVFLGNDVSFTSPTKKTESPFYQCEYLTKITLPSAQTSLTPYLLYGCTSLTSVDIPQTVTTIGKYALSSTGLTTVTIPANVTEMGEYTFANSSSLAEVTFADGIGLAAIPVYAFSDTGLTEITLPDSVESVGDYAFKSCTSLTSVTFGTGLTTLGNNILYGCTGQLELHFTGEYTYTDADGNTAELSIGSAAFNGINAYAFYPADSETWPEGTAVSTNATYGATSLVWAKEGEEVVVADWYYLDEDNGILYIYPDGAMPDYTRTSTPWYSKRTSITEIVFGADPEDPEETHEITHIGSYAFYGFSALESVTIPASVESIGDYAFSNCQLTGGVSGSTSTATNGITVESGLATVSFEEGSVLTEIGSYAFSECGYLSDITLPESLTTIGDYAFYQCGSEASYAICVYTQGSSDLSGAVIIAELVANSSGVSEIKVDAQPLTAGTDYTVETTDPDSENRVTVTVTLAEDYLESLSVGMHSCNVSFSEYTVSFELYIYSADTADEDKMEASVEMVTVTSGLKSIDLANVTQIGAGSFEECLFLQDVNFGSALEKIGSRAFYGCEHLSEIDLPDSLQEIGSYAFCGTPLEQLALPADVAVGTYAFSECTALQTITFAADEDTDAMELGSYAFNGCSALTEVTLPAEITTVSTGLFKDCSALESAVLLGDVTDIGASAFYGCSSLASVEGLSSVTAVGDKAFYTCTAFTSHDLPESLTNDQVGTFAFYNCTGLADESGFVIINGVLYSYVYSILGIEISGAEEDADSLQDVTIEAVTVPESVTEIADYAFYQIYDTAGGTNSNISTVTLEGLIFTCGADAVTFEEYAFSGLPLLAEYSGYTATIYYPCTDAEAWEAKLDAYGLTGSGESFGYRYSTNWSLVAEANHDYGEGTVIKEATCTEEGEISYTCSICGESTTEVITAAGHSWDEGVVNTAATCTEDGSITYTCTVCGETYTEAIAATGHSRNEGVVNTAATCTEDGSITYTCTVCEETYTETIAATGHSWDEGTETTAATCVDDGVLTYTCTVCGETYTEAIAATGEHDYESVITKEATCTEAGEKSYICTVCGDVAETEEIDALSETGEHNYEAVVTEPTETEQGYTTYTCTVCGDTYVSDYTDPTGSSDDGSEGSGSEGSGSEGSGSEGSGSEDSGSEGSGSEDSGSEDSGSEDSGSEDSGSEDSGSEGSGDGSGSAGIGSGSSSTGGGTTAKKTQNITVKKKITKTIKAKKLKKKAQTFKVKATAKGKVTFKKKSGSKKIKISKKGKVTVKKSAKKGTYKIKVKVTAAGTATYKKTAKTITITVKVK